jgi:hypothetical protein
MPRVVGSRNTLQKTLAGQSPTLSQDRLLPGDGNAEFLSFLGETAVDAAQGAVSAGLSRDIQQASDDFFQAQEDKTGLVEAEGIAAEIIEQNEGLLTKEEQAEDFAFKTASESIVRINERLANSPRTVAELEARIAAATKSAINRMPGRSNDFRRLAATLRGDIITGIDVLGLNDTDAADAEAKRHNAIMSKYREFGKSVGMLQHPNESDSLFVKRVDDNTLGMRNSELLGKVSDESYRAFARTPAYAAAVAADTGPLWASLHGIATGDTPIESKIAAIEATYSHASTVFASKHRVGADDPIVKNSIENHKMLRDTALKLARGEIQADEANNTLNRALITSATKLAQQDDRVFGAAVMSKLLSGPAMGVIMGSAAGIDTVIGGLDILNRGIQFPGSASSTENPRAFGEVTRLLKNNLPAMMTEDRDEVSQLIGGLQAAAAGSVRDGKPDFQTMKDWLDIASSPEYAKLVSEDTTGNLATTASPLIRFWDEELNSEGGEVKKRFDRTTMEAVNLGGNITFQAKSGVRLTNRQTQDLYSLQATYGPILNTLAKTQGVYSSGIDMVDTYVGIYNGPSPSVPRDIDDVGSVSGGLDLGNASIDRGFDLEFDLETGEFK